MTGSTTVKAWVTRYALTEGIREVEGEYREDLDMLIYTFNGAAHLSYAHGKGKQFHLTRGGAVKRANEMLVKRISNLEKQILKLKGMKFE